MPGRKKKPREQHKRSKQNSAIAESYSCATNAGPAAADTAASNSDSSLSQIFKGKRMEMFSDDINVRARAQIRATFYPKFENEKSDQEVRLKMIEVVSRGLGTLEVTLKHSGSLFMYAGPKGGAYAKNSFGNIYTAVGVFVLGRMFRESWGTLAETMQTEFNEFLENNRMSVSMELVTAVLGDHGQRPKEDYAVVTAVAELGNGKPKFFSTPEVIAFCRKWRLPTNHVWLFSNKKSVTSFFAAYDALCEEGIATTVCISLDEIADLSVPGSKDHVLVQGEILEGLVARVVSHGSLKHMENVLEDYPVPPIEGAESDISPTLREICSANKSNEIMQIKALLQSVGLSFCPDQSDWIHSEAGDSHSRSDDKSVISKLLKATPADFSSYKLQEMVRVIRERNFQVAFKCYNKSQKMNTVSTDCLSCRMVIHVYSDSVFRRYQKEMREKPGLWPLYRGFFVDIDLIKAVKDTESITGGANRFFTDLNGNSKEAACDELADDNSNLMIKLKFLTYKIRTFLVRNGLSILFKEGPSAYKAYYIRQMRTWGTSTGKQRELCVMLDEWADYARKKCGNKKLSSSLYLSVAEPFLEQYASRNPQNKALIGSAGSSVNSEEFLSILEDNEDDVDLKVPSSGSPVKEVIQKEEGCLVFFPGIPGCAKSALCKEILKSPDAFGEKRKVFSLMGDLIKGKYWRKVAAEHKKQPCSILLADKNAPNEDVWRQIEDMCRGTNVSAVPVVPDSEGTDVNPFSLDALAVFMFRVLQRVNHPGNLDKASPNAGYVLLTFYNLYNGKSRLDFECELVERFGFLIKMPLLIPERKPLPDSLRSIIEEGLSLFKLHTNRHGRLESTKGTYTMEWSKWEKKLREIILSNSKYLNSIQVPFSSAVDHVTSQLKSFSKGELVTPVSIKRKFGSIVYAAINLPDSEISACLRNVAANSAEAGVFMAEKDDIHNLKGAHVTLAHKRSHGVAAVAKYGHLLHRDVEVTLTALLFSPKMAAFEAELGTVDGERVVAKNDWPHVTLWAGEGVSAREANFLPLLFSQGKASRVVISPPFSITGHLKFH